MDDVSILPAQHRLDVDAYHRMADAGILGTHDRVELIDGELIDMAPIGQSHASMVSRLTRAFVLAGDRISIVWPQNPIRLDRYSEPQPDLAILRYRADFYETGERPGPADVLLLIEVADNSLAFDRRVKLPLYARAGIAEFWIVDVQRRILKVHRKPTGDGYAETITHRSGDRLALALAPEIVVALDLALGALA
jgi:Uma2 family endonuclease